MKLLRDFFRLRTAGRFSLSGRREPVRVSISVTVPQPLNQPAAQARPAAPWHEQPPAGTSRTSRHLHLVSSL
ncbi:MAG TPA: hypothetical protein VME63_06795 [Dyella sp.]|uniref:hypothetical protein n=1 Tax=Dyella sp. TaxID=1869338 RepID=UPI002C7B9B02|nr:hypothetical protein [Dyella sp.]HTV85093.1 hypothetical protein [Dyella sp.]